MSTEWNCTYLGAPPVTTADIVIGTVEVILGVLIVFLSLLVIIAIALFDKLKTYSNYGLFNLALADVWVGLSLGFLAAFYFHKELQLMMVPCLLRFILIVASCFESAWTLVVIAVERFIAVEYPFVYARMAGTNIKICLALTWVYSITFSFLPIMGWHTWTEDDCRCAMIDVFDGIYTITLGVHLILMITTMCILYTRIFWTTKRQLAKIGALEKNENTISKGTRKATKMMFMLLGVFICTWFPFLIVIFIQASMQMAGHPDYDNAFLSWLQIFTGVLGLTNSLWNPLIFAWKNRDFRLAFKKILTCNVKERNLVHDNSMNTSRTDARHNTDIGNAEQTDY